MASTVSISGLAGGRLAEHVEAAADLGVLEGAEVAVDVADHVGEVVVVGRHVAEVEVAVELGGDEQVPHLAPHGGQLGRVERLDLGVLVEELLEPGEVVVGVGPGHRRREVVDDDGVGAALGLGALARVVDHEGVEERQVAEGGVGVAAAPRGPSALPGSHSRVPCLPRWTTASAPQPPTPSSHR